MKTSELAAEFFRIFAGLERAHGRYTVRGRDQNKNKMEGSAATVQEPVTEDLWRQHLTGEYGLGIVPIRDDGTVRFGAIDVDDYSLDIPKMESEVRRLKLPLVPCRTKSGGVHLYLFCSEDTSAELVRGKLMEWAEALGHSGVEIFPKHSKLSENSVGNWINMPYQGGNRSVRYAVRQGERVRCEHFPAYADEHAVTEDQLRDIVPPKDEQHDEILYEAPPCLRTLAKRGIPEGTRNMALFNMGVYLRKRYAESWEEHLDEYNFKFLDPPLGHKEVDQIKKSVNRKDYEYTCSQQPICQVCSRQICLTRTYGIGGGDDDPGVAFDTMTMLHTDPPIFIWSVNGKQIEFNSQELMDQRRVHKRCIEELKIWPKPIKPAKWQQTVNTALQQAEEIEVPPDATLEGQLRAHLEAFCTGRATARSRDEILMGKPWHCEDDDRHYFRSLDFLRYLEQQRVRGVNERRLWAWLKREGADHHFFNIKGKGVNCWSVPAFERQTEDYDDVVSDDDQKVF